MTAVVDRFATSPERIRILRGLIAYRATLAQTMIVGGFQWLDGSFTENKELLLNEAPKDIDVVTFYELPENATQTELISTHPHLFDHDQVKETFFVDAYTYQIGGKLEALDVRWISYWYSMWSHRRNGQWKGFVEIPLNTTDDSVASALLDLIEQEGASQ